jgi:hypothetical protein
MLYPNSKLKHFLLVNLVIICILPYYAWTQTVTGEHDWTATIKKAMPAVVSIATFDEKGSALGTGSGFVAQADGVIVTNYHVIRGASNVQVITKQGEKYDVKGVVAFDIVQDYAIIRIPAVDLAILPMGNSNDVVVGEPVIAIGDPLGIVGSVSSGIISSPPRKVPEEFEKEGTWLQTTTPISGGNSGGPLINRRGQVLGMSTWARTYDRAGRPVQNLNFATPINYVRGVLQLSTAIAYTLPQIVKAEQEVARARAEKQAEEIRKLFSAYEDADRLFKLMVLKDWRMQRSAKPAGNGLTLVETMFAPSKAVLAELGGYLTDGMRVSMLLPAAGSSFTPENIEAWKTVFPENLLKSNAGFEMTNSGMILINDISVKVYTFEGKAARAPEAERTISYVFGNPRSLVQIDVVQPMSDVKFLDVLSTLAKTFEFGPNALGGGPPVNTGGMSFNSGSGSPSGTVTVREIETAFKSNLVDDAIQKSVKLLQTNPNSPEANAYLGLSLLYKRDADNAATYLYKAMTLGQQITLPMKRLKIPLIGHAFEEAVITISANELIVTAGGSYFKAPISGLSNSMITNYNNQCGVALIEGVFTETFPNSTKVKQETKKFNMFPPNSVLRLIQPPGKIAYSEAVCDQQMVHTTVLIKLLANLRARAL